MVKNVEFKKVPNSFQNQFKSDINNIKNETKVYMKADKTTNYYKVDVEKAEEWKRKSIKEATPKLVADIKSEAASLATELGVEDRIFATVENQAYNTRRIIRMILEITPSVDKLIPVSLN